MVCFGSHTGRQYVCKKGKSIGGRSRESSTYVSGYRGRVVQWGISSIELDM
jgi:hypothetical protein